MEKKKFGIGYSLVIHSLIMYLISGWIVGLSSNYIIPAMAGRFGTETSLLYTINTVGALISVIAAFFLSQMTLKRGVKLVTVISLLISAASAFIMGISGSFVIYIIAVILLFCFAQGYGFAVTNTLLSNWFPKNKAIVLGISTTGVFVANVTLTPAFSAVLSRAGIGNAMYLFAGICLIMGIVSIFWLKNRPQDVGLTPDNRPIEVEQTQQTQTSGDFKSKWTIKKLLKTPIIWYFIICYGFMLLVSSGFPAQLVGLMTTRGMTQPQALYVMMLTAPVGIAGSIVTGIIDRKIGAKRTTLIMNVVFIVSLFFLALITGGRITVAFISIISFFLGGCFNMCPSLAITIFGAEEYISVNRIIHPLTQAIKACSFVAIAIGGSISTSNSGVMWVFLVCIVISTIFVIPIKNKASNTEATNVS